MMDCTRRELLQVQHHCLSLPSNVQVVAGRRPLPLPLDDDDGKGAGQGYDSRNKEMADELDALRTRDGRDMAPQQQQQMNTESGEEGGNARARILALAQHQRQDDDGK